MEMQKVFLPLCQQEATVIIVISWTVSQRGKNKRLHPPAAWNHRTAPLVGPFCLNYSDDEMTHGQRDLCRSVSPHLPSRDNGQMKLRWGGDDIVECDKATHCP